MKKILLLFVATLVTNFVFGQKFKKLEVNTGISLFAPIAKDVTWDDKAWGQRVQFVKPRNDKFAYILNLGIQQNSDKSIQLPALLNARHFVYQKIYVTYGAGATFFKNEGGRFTLTTGWGIETKKLIIEQSVFRTTRSNYTTLDVFHNNNIGVSVMYRL
jgi:hypothetical protein